MSGFLICEGTGQFLFIHNPGGGMLHIRELFVWNEPLVTTNLINPTKSGLTQTTGNFGSIFVPNSSAVTSCSKFLTSNGGGTINFDLPQPSAISNVFLVLGDPNSIAQVTVSVYESVSNTWYSCGDKYPTNQNWHYWFACSDIIGSQVKLDLSEPSSDVKEICKIGVFGTGCPASVTVSEDPLSPWTETTTTFNLLTQSTETVTFPSIVTSPAGCYPVTWKARRQSNGNNVVSNETFYSLSLTGFTISHVISNFNQRLTKAAKTNTAFYFEGTVQDQTLTKTSPFNFKIQFIDDCRSATIIPQIIDFPDVEWDVDLTKTLSVPAFSDSVEATGQFSTGICGEKDVVLNNPPPFVTLTKGLDPIVDPFVISYDQSLATEADIGTTHTVDYTVDIVEYSGITSVHQGQFSITIKCQAQISRSSVVSPIDEVLDYDLASNSVLKINAPIVSVNPPQCFSVAEYPVIDVVSLKQPEYLSVVDLSSYEIQTQNRTLIGNQTLSVSALVDNGQLVDSQNLRLLIYDSCNSTYLIETEQPKKIEIRALENTPQNISLTVFEDTISESFKKKNSCGYQTYKVLGHASSIVSVSHEAGSSTYEISVNTSSFTEVGLIIAEIEVGLLNYPDLAKQKTSIQIDVKPILSTWVPVFPEVKNITEPEPEIEEPVVTNVTNQTTEIVFVLDPRLYEKAYVLAGEIREGVNENQISFPNPVPSIVKLTETGLVQISFSKPMKRIPDEINLKTLSFLFEPDDWRPSLQVYVDPAETQDPKKVSLAWSVISYEPDSLQIQLDFNDPLYISFEKKPDFLVVQFDDERFFITENGIKILPEDRILRRSIRRQLPKSAQNLQVSLNSSAQGSQVATMVIMTGNILLSVGLQQLLSMVAALQVIILLPLMNSSMPANTGSFFAMIMDIAAFDLIEIDGYINQFLGMQISEPVNEKFETMGIESIFFMNNLGTFTLVLILNLMLVALWFLLTWPEKCSKRLRRMRKKLGKRLFWDSWIVAVTESYLVVSLCIGVSLKYSLAFDSYGQTIQSIFCLICVLIYTLLPVFIIVQVYLGFKGLKEKFMQASFGSFTQDIDVQKGRKVLIYPALTLGRRLFLVYIVLFGSEEFCFQIMQMMVSTLVHAVTNLALETSLSHYESRLFVFTTLTVLMICYSFMNFDMLDVETNFTSGYYTIGIVVIYMLIVLSLILVSSLKALKHSIKINRVKKAYRRQRKELQAKLKDNHPRMKLRLRARLDLQVEQDQELGNSMSSSSSDDRSQSISSEESSEESNTSSSRQSALMPSNRSKQKVVPQQSEPMIQSKKPSSHSFARPPGLDGIDYFQKLVDDILLGDPMKNPIRSTTEKISQDAAHLNQSIKQRSAQRSRLEVVPEEEPDELDQLAQLGMSASQALEQHLKSSAQKRNHMPHGSQNYNPLSSFQPRLPQEPQQPSEYLKPRQSFLPFNQDSIDHQAQQQMMAPKHINNISQQFNAYNNAGTTPYHQDARNHYMSSQQETEDIPLQRPPQRHHIPIPSSLLQGQQQLQMAYKQPIVVQQVQQTRKMGNPNRIHLEETLDRYDMSKVMVDFTMNSNEQRVKRRQPLANSRQIQDWRNLN